jgi:hypothetical protein
VATFGHRIVEERMQDRRVEWNFSQGWGFAGFITLLAIAAYVGAGMLKSRTYHSPTDPLAPTSGQDKAH